MLPSHILKGIEIGSIPASHIIRWADQMILAAEKPELWLIDLATTRANRYDVLDTLRRHGASTEVDDDTLLALVAYGFFHSRLTLEQARAELYDRFCLIDWKELTPLRQKVYNLDDEMEREAVRAGQARRTCEDILQPFRDAGERLVRDYMNDT